MHTHSREYLQIVGLKILAEKRLKDLTEISEKLIGVVQVKTNLKKYTIENHVVNYLESDQSAEEFLKNLNLQEVIK